MSDPESNPIFSLRSVLDPDPRHWLKLMVLTECPIYCPQFFMKGFIEKVYIIFGTPMQFYVGWRIRIRMFWLNPALGPGFSVRTGKRWMQT